MSRASSEGYQVWQRAKPANDFAAYLPVLEKNIDLRHRYVECFDPREETYDVLLDDYERGMTTAEVREIFDELKAELLPLIAAARAADTAGAITFDVADATSLPYQDGSFGQALYLQQVICTIEDPAGREAALREASRVLRPGGRALFSFVCLESRLASPAQRAYVAYLRAVRTLRRSRRPLQSMPRLRLSGRFDLGSLRDDGPYNWWYRAEEAEADLIAAGFVVEAIGFGADAESASLKRSAAEALAGGAAGTLYAVALNPV
jgi:SAM-dependent methyltransferase